MDAFGEGLMDFYRGDRAPHAIRRDDGYVSEAGFDPYFTEYNEWPEGERKALECVKGRALDVGCGAGRHSLWLQQRGFRVVAIDVSPLAMEVARLRGVKECRVMNARHLTFRPKSFDTVLLMGVTFGIAGNVEATKKMLQDLHRITSEDARIIASCRDPLATDKHEHLKYHELNRRRGRPIGQLTLRVEYKEKIGDWFDLLIVSPKEMTEICKAAGWKVTKVFHGKGGIYISTLKKI